MDKLRNSQAEKKERARQAATRGQNKPSIFKNLYVTFIESLVTLPRIVGIKRLEEEDVIMRKDCPKLRLNSGKAILCKRAGSAVMRVMEIQGSASGEDAGKADTRYDVRTEVQDGLLQLASGERVPAMIDWSLWC